MFSHCFVTDRDYYIMTCRRSLLLLASEGWMRSFVYTRKSAPAAQGQTWEYFLMFMRLSCTAPGIYDRFQHNGRVVTRAHGMSGSVLTNVTISKFSYVLVLPRNWQRLCHDRVPVINMGCFSQRGVNVFLWVTRECFWRKAVRARGNVLLCLWDSLALLQEATIASNTTGVL